MSWPQPCSGQMPLPRLLKYGWECTLTRLPGCHWEAALNNTPLPPATSPLLTSLGLRASLLERGGGIEGENRQKKTTHWSLGMTKCIYVKKWSTIILFFMWLYLKILFWGNLQVFNHAGWEKIKCNIYFFYFCDKTTILLYLVCILNPQNKQCFGFLY